MTEIRNLTPTLLSDNWYTLKKYAFELRNGDGEWIYQEREAYDRGNGATILLYNLARQTVILTRQFRLPTYVNGNPSGYLIEACAGILDGDHPEDCIRKESIEETGYQVTDVEKVFEAYMSPGSVTEIVHFFIGQYSANDKVSAGGGVKAEQEDIEVLELGIEAARSMIETGEIRDGKTILLLYHLAIKGIM